MSVIFLRATMALNAKDPRNDQLARRLAALTGESITAAVKAAVRKRIERTHDGQPDCFRELTCGS